MGAIQEVKVLSRADHSERSEAQLRKGDRAWEGSVERNREPMDKNRIRGVVDQGERAVCREALVVEEKLRISGGCAVKDRVLTWGDLASRLKGRRPRGRSEKSAEAVVTGVAGPMRPEVNGEGPNEKES
jgi:hypothetical protein